MISITKCLCEIENWSHKCSINLKFCSFIIYAWVFCFFLSYEFFLSVDKILFLPLYFFLMIWWYFVSKGTCYSMSLSLKISGAYLMIILFDITFYSSYILSKQFKYLYFSIEVTFFKISCC
jgi:hypothetical protein